MGERRERLVVFLAFVFPFALYLLTAYRDVTYWDVGEMDTVPWILGIAHPTAFPAYVLIAWAFGHLFPIGSVAFRMSALSALAMSLACWLIARMVWENYRSAWAGVVAGVLFACGTIAWSDATRADVHALATMFFVVLLYASLRWYRSGADGDAYLAAAAFGTGIAVHPTIVTTLPALLLLVIARMHETDVRAIVRAVGVALISMVVWFVYLPLRSSFVVAHGLDPTLALGLNGSAFWDYDHPASMHGFLALISGAQFGVARGFSTIGSDATGEQFVRYVADFVREFTFVGAIAALFGAIVAWRRNAVATGALVLSGGISVLFALSFTDESDVGRYFLPSFAVASIFAGTACGIWRRWPARVTSALALVCTSAWLVHAQPWFFNQPHDTRAREAIEEVRAATPDGSVLVATWVFAPPLAYCAYVEHRLGSRIVDPAWIGDESERLASWTAVRPVFVVGTPQGSIPGFHLERLATRTEVYRVVWGPLERETN